VEFNYIKMGTLLEWLENKAHYLMTTFICFQSFIFVILILLYFFAQEKIQDLLVHIYTWCVLVLFMAFMIYFAYHSVKLFLNIDQKGILHRTISFSSNVNN
jgi:uncharacterized protein YacL